MTAPKSHVPQICQADWANLGIEINKQYFKTIIEKKKKNRTTFQEPAENNNISG